MSEPVLVVPDISVAYVVVVVVVVISLGTMVQFPVQHSSQEVKTQLAELEQQEEEGKAAAHSKRRWSKRREEKRRVNQSSKTSEHAITGRVVTAKGKRGGAIRVHSISSMEHTNRN